MPITQITVKQPQFEAAVKWAAKWLDKKPNVPVHAGLSLTHLGGNLEIIAYSEAVTARAVIDAGAIKHDGPHVAVVSGRLLDELAGTFAATKPVVLAGDGKDVAITSGKFRATLPTFDENDFPALPGRLPTIGTVPGAALADAVARVGAAAGKDPSRGMILATMHVGFGEKVITLTGSDRQRAARIEVPWTGEVVDEQATPLSGTLIDAAAAFAGPDDVEIGLDGFNLSFTSPTRSLTVRLVDIGGDGWPVQAVGQFFAFEQEQTTAVEVDGDLFKSLKRAAIVRGKTGPVRLTFGENTLAIGAAQAEAHQESADEVEIDYDGPEFTVAVNPDYLTDALGSAPAGAPVQVGFGIPKKPITLRSDADPTWRHVLMPVVI